MFFSVYLAKNFAEQIKTIKRKEMKLPVMIPLTGLELIKDSDSPYKLSFKILEDAEIIYSPQLDSENNYRRFAKTDKDGLPIFIKGSYDNAKYIDRIFKDYTKNSGLSRLTLHSGKSLSCGSPPSLTSGLWGPSGTGRGSKSYKIGRIVVVSGTQKKEREF